MGSSNLDSRTRRRGSLAVVGTGIRIGEQTTIQAVELIREADEVFYLLSDGLGGRWIRELNSRASSLHSYYEDARTSGLPRSYAYFAIARKILESVRSGNGVCLALYGHPGVFAAPTRITITLVRRAGYPAVLQPGVSAQDCLFADLELDPADLGCQSYEATQFLRMTPQFDPRVPLLLWQIGFAGAPLAQQAGPNRTVLLELQQLLDKHYGASHETVLYECPTYPVGTASIRRIPLERLHSDVSAGMGTLYVPPISGRFGR